MDHAIMGVGEESRHGDKVALVILDRFSGYISAFPAQTKSAEEVTHAIQSFVASDSVKRV